MDRWYAGWRRPECVLCTLADNNIHLWRFCIFTTYMHNYSTHGTYMPHIHVPLTAFLGKAVSLQGRTFALTRAQNVAYDTSIGRS